MSKTNKDLEHDIRKMIYNHIVEYPGVSFSTLKKVFDLNDSTLRYHLQYLERNERITPNIEDGKVHLYPFNDVHLSNSSTASKSSNSPHNLTQHQKVILNAIRQHPRITQKELGKRTALKRFILTYNLTKLIDLGMIRKNNHDHAVCYETITNQQLQNEILKVLTVKLLNNEITEQTFNELKKKINS
jgi:predicted transcriptional regulator